MTYSIPEIADIIGARILQSGEVAQPIEHLLIDSRQVIFPATSLFFALRGARQDGHDFVEALYRQGVRSFVISQSVAVGKFPEANLLKVENPHQALQILAAHRRRQFSIPVIGITGSNGKTIVKEWLFQLMAPDKRIVRSPKSFNSQVGVPLSVWQMQPEHELAIFEAGISRKGEMAKLAPIICPTVGIFTNIGAAHSEGFASTEEKIREKIRLFDEAETVIFCLDNQEVTKAFEEKLSSKKWFTWSRQHTQANLQIVQVKSLTTRTEIHGIFKGSLIEITIPFSDAASTENAIHCWATMLFFGYENAIIAERIAHLEPVAMRLEMKAGIHNCLIINDSYNSDLSSFKIALDFMVQQSAHPTRTIILSDILQSGLPQQELYRTVANLLSEKNVARLIGIGNEVKALREFLPEKTGQQFFRSTEEFLQNFDFQTFTNETILLKGARHFEFEKIANRLALKVHNTTLEINLDALKHNLNVFARHLLPGVKMMVMVKAGGYGSGSAEVGRLLEFQNADYLGVAYADEGIELRKAGIRLPIMVLNPEEATFDALFRYSLEPEMYNLRILKAFIASIPDSGEEAPIHIKLDTGMHRLGFEPTDLQALAESLQSEPRLKVRSVFSHLAASEAAEHDGFTKQQFDNFQKMYEPLAAALGYRPLRHIVNSAGIVRFPQCQMDMVRLGIGLYGVDVPGTLKDQLQVVHTLKATISQIKNLPKGETVGYGRRGKVESPMRIATISIGYADGLLRAAGNGRFSVLIRGKRAPIVGSVCMDMTMVDITQIPAAEEGDEVIIFGAEPTVEELAKCYGSIAYEVFTGIAGRVKRVYFQE